MWFRATTILLVAFAMIGATGAAAAGEPSSLATRCPAYPERLQAARALLARGDRAGAATALRSAQAALEACLREEAAHGGHLAGQARLPSGRSVG